MLRIHDTKSTPRGKWKYPGVDGFEIVSNSYMNLMREVVIHYKGNGQEPPSEQEIIQYLCDNTPIPCFEGREPYPNQFTDPATYGSGGIHSSKWPLVLQPFRLMIKEGDKGLGDIIHRVIGDGNSEAFKKWHLKVFGAPCGCGERHRKLNVRFPI